MWFPRVVVAGLLALAALACGAEVPPNVVLVSVDTLRADALGAYGGPIATPTFDALAEAGVLYENALAPSAETAPSHATLFTGQGVLRHRVTQNGVVLPESTPSLAAHFRASGYGTAGFVSSFVLDPRFGWARGFDSFDATFTKAGSSFEHETNPGFWDDYEITGFDRPGRITTARARAWLADAEEPFFLFVHYFDPHSPYRPAPAYLKKVAGFDPDVRGRWVPGLTRGEVAALTRGYHAEVLQTDDVLAALLEALDRRGLRERTVIAVTADHGEGLGQHGWLAHQVSLYEELVRVPLLLSWKGRIPAGVRVEEPVGLVDLFATLADLTGTSPPKGVEGRPLPVRDSPGVEAPALFLYRRFYATPYFGHRGEMFGIRTRRWKYVRATEHPDELFDLTVDPGELENLARLRPGVVARLGSLIDERLRQTPLPGESAALDAATREGLEALGYLGAETEEEPESPAPSGREGMQ